MKIFIKQKTYNQRLMKFVGIRKIKEKWSYLKNIGAYILEEK